MKRVILILGIILLSAMVLFSSCSDNEAEVSPTLEPSLESPTPTPTPTQTPTPTPTPTPEEQVILVTGLC